MIPRLDFGGDTRGGFPRVSGDDPSSRETFPSLTMFSPRERG